MAARLKDIARALNISISTVSYALNDGPRQVNSDIRKLVISTAREMGYRPNRLARSLAAGKTKTLGVVPVVIGSDFIASAYFQGCFAGIVTEAKALDYDVLLYTHDALDPARLGGVVLDGRADGLIFLAPFRDLLVLDLVKEENIPFSIISGLFDGQAPTFRCDNTGGIRQVVEHLVSLGHTKIAHFAGDQSMVDGHERLQGFLAAAKDFSLTVREEWITCHMFMTSTAYDSAMQLFARGQRPTAIVCASDEIAAGVYKAAREVGIKIPEELSVTGFDNSTVALLLTPQLTTIRQPLGEMASAATRAVTSLIECEDVSSASFSIDLVIRQSTARPKEVIL